MDFIFFLGRFHVLALHLPIGIIFAAIGLEFINRKQKDPKIKATATTIWGFGAIAAILTVILGLMHAQEAGFDGNTVELHKWFGISVAIVTSMIWLIKRTLPSLTGKTTGALAFLMIILLSVTGHYGGNITHGSTYLVEYAPPILKKLAGVSYRPPVTNIAEADLYLDIVQPLLSRRCGSCHNDDKQKGELSLVGYDGLMKGGKHGPVIIIGEESELFKRITLSPDDEEFMPAEGKTPLTDPEIALIDLWIKSGAPENLILNDAKATEDQMKAAADFLGLGIVEDLPPLPTNSILNTAQELGIDVRFYTISSPLLIVDLSVAGGQLTDEKMKTLNGLAPNIIELNLKDLDISPEVLANFQDMPSLKVLNLSNTSVSDTMVVNLLNHTPNLEVLNLFNAQKITPEGINALTDFKNLQRIYPMNTNL